MKKLFSTFVILAFVLGLGMTGFSTPKTVKTVAAAMSKKEMSKKMSKKKMSSKKMTSKKKMSSKKMSSKKMPMKKKKY